MEDKAGLLQITFHIQLAHTHQQMFLLNLIIMVIFMHLILILLDTI